jgi:S-adenosylmethionine decarboxylase
MLRKIFKRREGDLNALGKHLLLELRDCDREVLNDLDRLQKALIAATEEAGATVIGKSFHQFSPQGVSGVVLLAESHLCLHTWPEYNYAAADVFTCGDSVEPRVAAERLIRELDAKAPTMIEMSRGVLTDLT